MRILKRRFKDIRNFLLFHLQDGYLSCIVWKDLKSYKNQYRNLQEDIRDLFGIHISAHKNYAFSCMARIVDSHKDAWGLEKFFGVVNNYFTRSDHFTERHLSELHEDYDRFRDEYKSDIDSIREMRDIYFSHFDKKSVLKQHFNYEKEWTLKGDQLEKLYLALINLINKYSVMIDGKEWDPSGVTIQDSVKNILQKLLAKK